MTEECSSFICLLPCVHFTGENPTEKKKMFRSLISITNNVILYGTFFVSPFILSVKLPVGDSDCKLFMWFAFDEHADVLCLDVF